MKRILALQFGNVYQRRYPGYTIVSRLYTNPCYIWLDPVRENGGRNIRDARHEGYLHSNSPATLSIGVPDGTYEIILTAFTNEPGHGPYAVTVNGRAALAEVELPVGKVSRHRFAAQARRGRLDIRFTPRQGADFLVNTLEVRAARAVELRPVFRSAPPITMPVRGPRRAAPDLPKALGQICDWLIDHRQANGFLGDTYSPGKRSSYWYSVSMTSRALMAGYQLLGRKEYLQAVTRLLDVFVDEQLPNGAWEATLRRKPTRSLTRGEVRTIMAHERQPLSDIGSVVSTLAIGATHVSGARRARYVSALQKFCDEWAPQFQNRDGAFTDGFWPPYTAIYSCATAIEAAAFALTHRVTGESRYLQVATRAIRYLLKDWRTDGRMLGRAPHWTVHNHQPFVLDKLYFGDLWYYDEGFITTWHHASDPAFRRDVSQALHNRVHGSAGVLAALGNATWWPVRDGWNNAKSIGMVQTLLFAQTHGDGSPRLTRALEDMRYIVGTPEYSRRVGVMMSDAGRPVAQHYIRSWAGLRMESTGFAGMTIAEMIQPGILYLV